MWLPAGQLTAAARLCTLNTSIKYHFSLFAVRLSLHTDYALRTLMFLASEQRRVQTGEIADFFGISKDHLAKVVQRLAHLELIRSIRGVGGGIELARPAESIGLLEVIEPIEGSLHLLDCVGMENVCVIQPGCRLRTILAEAEQLQRDYFARFTIADVMQPGVNLVQLTGGV